jgi:allantoicase
MWMDLTRDGGVARFVLFGDDIRVLVFPKEIDPLVRVLAWTCVGGCVEVCS